MPENILVLMPFSPEYQAQTLLMASDHKVQFIGLDPPSPEALREATVIIGNPEADALQSCRRLKWMQVRTAGVDMYTAPGVFPPGALLTSASGGYGTAISEYLLSVTLALHKQLHLYRDRQSRHVWAPATDIRCIKGSMVLVIGTGDIGSQYAKKMHALGARVFGIRRTVGKRADYFESIGTLSDLDTLVVDLAVADCDGGISWCAGVVLGCNGEFRVVDFSGCEPGRFARNHVPGRFAGDVDGFCVAVGGKSDGGCVDG